LVTSTGLTLVMVPATFTWIDDLERWVSRKIGHRWINSTSDAVAGVIEAPGAPPSTAAPAAPGTGSPLVQPASGHAQDLPHGPLPDAAT
jgi:hypothetical protein